MGSLLGTKEDIERGKIQTNIAYCTLQQIFNSKQISETGVHNDDFFQVSLNSFIYSRNELSYV